jgi:TPR repeat protein
VISHLRFERYSASMSTFWPAGTGSLSLYEPQSASFAAKGNSDAENQLGWMCQFGQGVQPDDARALRWYQLSANRATLMAKTTSRL